MRKGYNWFLPMLFLMYLILSGTANAWEFKPFKRWDNTEKAMFAAHQVIRTVDMFQTQAIYDSPNHWEVNPVIDIGVDKFGTHFIPAYFISTAIIEYVVVDALPSKYRKMALVAGTSVSLGLVYHNHSLGLGMKFTF